MDDVEILTRFPVSRYRLSVAEFRRLGEAGVLSEDDRVELIEGQLVAMSPIGPRHALAVDALADLLHAALIAPARVRTQNPVTLDDGTEPCPDIAVVRSPWRGHPDTHPGPDDIYLLVEVADSSLATDRGAKRAVYARAGVREYWIVDLANLCVHVHRAPVGDAYTQADTLRRPSNLTIEALPGISIPTEPLFG